MVMHSIDMDSDDFFKTEVVDYSRKAGNAEDSKVEINLESSSDSDTSE